MLSAVIVEGERRILMTPSEISKAVEFEGANPILRVKDLSASTEYYVAKLGFKIAWQTPIFASVSRGKCHLFLSEGDQGNPGSWVWIGVEDADHLFKEYTANGVKVRNPPTNYSWAYEMQVEDLDGNVLRLGSDQKNDQPIGEWLDMRGDLWSMSSTGEWTRATKV
jgi:catechol 2,3-dioxygenase-like lactoylglutathione lyase family enzyme